MFQVAWELFSMWKWFKLRVHGSHCSRKRGRRCHGWKSNLRCVNFAYTLIAEGIVYLIDYFDVVFFQMNGNQGPGPITTNIQVRSQQCCFSHTFFLAASQNLLQSWGVLFFYMSFWVNSNLSISFFILFIVLYLQKEIMQRACVEGYPLGNFLWTIIFLQTSSQPFLELHVIANLNLLIW